MVRSILITSTNGQSNRYQCSETPHVVDKVSLPYLKV